MVHQKDPRIGEVLDKAGYKEILKEGVMRDGKAEGMILGALLVRMAGKKYIGFVDTDNYVPSSTREYVESFAAGFSISNKKYIMVRTSWKSKPKVREGGLFFPMTGRVSEITNRYLNSIISDQSRHETDVIKTGNAGEHAMSMSLFEKIKLASGFGVEPSEYINLFEEYSGVEPTPHKDVLKQGVEVYQIEPTGPHLYETRDENKGHIQRMLGASLSVVFHSSLASERLKKEILKETNDKVPEKPIIYPPIEQVRLRRFAKKIDDSITKLGR